MAEVFSPEVVKGLLKRLDTSGNGTLSRGILLHCMSALEPSWSQEELDVLICASKADRGGCVGIVEFVDAIFSEQPEAARNEAVCQERPIQQATADHQHGCIEHALTTSAQCVKCPETTGCTGHHMVAIQEEEQCAAAGTNGARERDRSDHEPILCNGSPDDDHQTDAHLDVQRLMEVAARARAEQGQENSQFDRIEPGQATPNMGFQLCAAATLSPSPITHPVVDEAVAVTSTAGGGTCDEPHCSNHDISCKSAVPEEKTCERHLHRCSGNEHSTAAVSSKACAAVPVAHNEHVEVAHKKDVASYIITEVGTVESHISPQADAIKLQDSLPAMREQDESGAEQKQSSQDGVVCKETLPVFSGCNFGELEPSAPKNQAVTCPADRLHDSEPSHPRINPVSNLDAPDDQPKEACKSADSEPSHLHVNPVNNVEAPDGQPQECCKSAIEKSEARASSTRLGPAEALMKMAGSGLGNASVVIRLLDHQRPDVRRAAIQALGMMGKGASSHASSIAKRLLDDDVVVRQEAVKALNSIGPAARTQAANDLEQGLKQESITQRCLILDALGQLGEPARSKITSIGLWLVDQDKSVRRAAARALVELALSESAHSTAGTYHDNQMPSEVVFLSAVDALRAMGVHDEALLLELFWQLEHEVAGVRRAAVHAIRIQSASGGLHAKALALLLQDSDSEVCFLAAKTLGRLHGAANQHVGELAKLLEDGSIQLCRAAVEALGKFGTCAASYACVVSKYLTSADADLRLLAAESLGNMAQVPEVQVCCVANLLEDDDTFVRDAASKALIRMDALVVHACAVTKRLKHQNPSVRLAAVHVIASSDAYARANANLLADLAKDCHPEICREAAEVMRKTGISSTSDSDASVGLMERDPAHLRCAALTTLGKKGKAAASHAAAIARWLEHENPDVRCTAAETLGKIGDSAIHHADAIVQRLVDNDARVRCAAALALSDMGPPAVKYSDSISTLLEDDIPRVRQAAVQALCKFVESVESCSSSLIDKLEHQRLPIRRYAVDVLCKVVESNATVTDAVLSRLRHGRVEVQCAAIDILTVINQDAAHAALADMIHCCST